MRAAAARAALAVVASITLSAPTAAGSATASEPAARGLVIEDVLGGDPAGFARASTPRAFVFPADHGSHPEFRTEWWYFTGTLRAEDGRRFGFQLTFFRFAVAAEQPPRDSAWATRQVWMAHFAVSDEAGRRFAAHERFARGALGMAGARAAPFRVWLDDWAVDGADRGLAPAVLRAREGDDAIELALSPGKPVVLQGDAGLSRKSAEPGNASYYYSLTRLPARGVVTVDGVRHTVRGEAWLDREWGTSALAADQVGWDWFALRLDDGRELMFYQLRRRDGTADPASAGSLVEVDGRRRPLAAGDVRLTARSTWRSPRSGARYPVAWRLEVPAEGIDLEVVPWLTDQELDVSFRYWEGAVDVRGRAGDRAVRGEGYLEMTGYRDG
ncbi:MAG: carotenoid 1,2-hydratase [Ectothiorhodospiraceae bacterium]|nr:carotenoid 1,2-hydratase [Ectothiorhodospiraceae bacterium]